MRKQLSQATRLRHGSSWIRGLESGPMCSRCLDIHGGGPSRYGLSATSSSVQSWCTSQDLVVRVRESSHMRPRRALLPRSRSPFYTEAGITMTCSWWEGLSNKPRRFGPISLVLGAEEIWPPFPHLARWKSCVASCPLPSARLEAEDELMWCTLVCTSVHLCKWSHGHDGIVQSAGECKDYRPHFRLAG